MGIFQSKNINRNIENDIATANLVASMLKDSEGRTLRIELVENGNKPQKIMIYKEPKEDNNKIWILNTKQFYVFFSKVQTYWEETEKNIVTPTPKDEDENECIICLERDVEVVLECTHKFCKSCIEKWTSKEERCPMCNQFATTNNDNIWYILDSPSKEELQKDVENLLDNMTKNILI